METGHCVKYLQFCLLVQEAFCSFYRTMLHIGSYCYGKSSIRAAWCCYLFKFNPHSICFYTVNGLSSNVQPLVNKADAITALA